LPVPVCSVVVFFAHPVNTTEPRKTTRSKTTINFVVNAFFIPTLLSLIFYSPYIVLKIKLKNNRNDAFFE
jgi:hypothetical protein